VVRSSMDAYEAQSVPVVNLAWDGSSLVEGHIS
jgi:hypothetical protein